nr:hypothetical protein [uncultured Flavobacterium sp.]
MLKNEYLTVKDIADKYTMSTRNVRRIISTLENKCSEVTLHKDKNGHWQVHYLLVSNFKPQRIRRDKYYAVTIDPTYKYSVKDIDVIMKFVFDQLVGYNTEINYVVEQKKTNEHNHIHSYVKCSNKRKLINCFRLGFGQLSYHESVIFDLNGWKQYITKENNNIKTLKN